MCTLDLMRSPYSYNRPKPNENLFVSGSMADAITGRPINPGALFQFVRNEALSREQVLRVRSTSGSTADRRADVAPGYVGHIPGLKFCYGNTFGQISKDALGRLRARN